MAADESTVTLHDFAVRAADGQLASLRDYTDQVLLIVNVASRCGMTPQYAGLEELQRDFAPRGLRVLGFPCNQFGAQEPGTDQEIQQFCSTTYNVTFPVFGKIDVNGPAADPLYAYLRTAVPGDIRWNFTKFLVGRDGTVLRRFEPADTPEQFRPDVEAALAD